MKVDTNKLMKYENIIIGSSFSAVALAKSLLNDNQKVLMLDGGIKLEKTIKNKVEKISNNFVPSKYPVEWTNNDKKSVRKKLFNSEFFIEKPSNIKFSETHKDFVEPKISYAVGGFSNIWGAQIDKIPNEILADWIIGAKINNYYEQTFEMLGVGSYDKAKKIRKNSLAEHLRKSYNNYFDPSIKLKSILIEPSILAIDNLTCINCGFCMNGCIKNSIYSTNKTISDMSKNSNFTYKTNHILQSFVEKKKKVTLSVLINNERNSQLEAERIFLALGPINSTRLVSSASKRKKPIYFEDSLDIVFLGLLMKNFKNEQTKKVSLSEMQIKLKNIFGLKSFIDVSVYSSSMLVENAIENAIPKILNSILSILKRFIQKRIVVLKVRFGGIDSPLIKMEGKDDKWFEVDLTITRKRSTKMNAFYAWLALIKNFYKIKIICLPIFKVNKSGSSVHFGSSMPITKTISNDRINSDILGRPNGFKRVHCIDASVLPQITGGSLTTTIMANAIRIGDILKGK